MSPLLAWLQVAMSVGERDAAGRMVEALRPLAGNLSTRARDLSCIGRILGDAAAFLGDTEAARSYYDQALAVCQRARFRPEIALIRLGLAELAVEQDPTEARDHLDFAIKEFEAMKMAPSLERALSLQATLNL